MIKSPVLFLIFNRIENSMKVFEKIREYRPSHLFIGSDGPRVEKLNESQIVENLRELITSSIDWPCEVNTLFRGSNLGCKISVSSSIDWFFSRVEHGIILEDDCLPSSDFFRFCDELLPMYKNDFRVFSICGFNSVGSINNSSDSYYFSRYFSSWGWASWRSRWELLDLQIIALSEGKHRDFFEQKYSSSFEKSLRFKRLDDFYKQKVNSWAIPWYFCQELNDGFSIIPRNNLIENIGFSNRDSTHTIENYFDKFYLHHQSKNLDFPLIHPVDVNLNTRFRKRYLMREFFRVFLKKIFSFF